MRYNWGMKHIGEHLSRAGQGSNEKKTERGELLKYFQHNLNIARARDGIPPVTVGRLARLLQGIPTTDLYYLKSVCDQAEHFSKKFWWEIDPKKHKT